MKKRINMRKIQDLSFLWGRLKNIKKSADSIVKEIDKGEDYSNEK